MTAPTHSYSPPTPQHPQRLLFVCMGNICRSPLAHAIFLHQARERHVLDRFIVDSCGTGGWHAGEPPDPRTIAVAERRRVTINHRARQFSPRSDLTQFDLLLPMDRSNLRHLIDHGAPAASTRLLREFDPAFANTEAPDVPDPYYGGPEGFDHMFDMLWSACDGLLNATLTGSHSSLGSDTASRD